MSKIELQNVQSGYNLSRINENFQEIERVIDNEILFRSNPTGEPNELLDDLDVNGKKVYNLPMPVLDSQAARLKDVRDAIAGGSGILISFEPYKEIVGPSVQEAIQQTRDFAESYTDATEISLQAEIGLVDDKVDELANTHADETQYGLVLRATEEEAVDGVEATKYITPSTLQAALSALVSGEIAWLGKGIGEIVTLDVNAPLPPTDNPLYRYVVLTAGQSGAGGYNEGVLTGESTSGISPNIVSTATINSPGSPMHGKTVRLTNTSREFYRPGLITDTPQMSQNAAHSHAFSAAIYGGAGASLGTDSPVSSGTTSVTQLSGGDEARSRNCPAAFIMRAA